MPKLKPLMFSRGRALVMLSRGHNIEEVVDYLHARHPNFSRVEVKKAYFPKTGTYAISSIMGESRAKASERFKKLIKNDKALHDLHKDPEFAAKRDAISSARFRSLNENKEFAVKRDERLRALQDDQESATKRNESSRKRLLALNKDPEFAAKRDERLRSSNKDQEHQSKFMAGAKAFWEDYSNTNFQEFSSESERLKATRDALDQLPGLQRLLLSRLYGITLEHDSGLVDKANELNEKETSTIINKAFRNLRIAKVKKKRS